MAKWTNDSAMDAACSYISTNYAQIYLCSQQPANYTEASTTYALAGKTGISSGTTGPADGDASGRKITIDAVTSISVSASGTANHVAITSTDALLAVTTCTDQALTTGNTAQTAAFDIEFLDPS